MKYDVVSTLKYDVETTLKSDVVSTLKYDVETTLKMGCFPNVEINNVVSTLKIGCSMSRPKLNLKTTLKQRCVPAGPILKFKAFEEQDKSSDIELQPPFGNKAIHCLKRSGGGLQNEREHHIILTKYEAVHPAVQ